jgi:hypothetical protein
MLHASRSSVRAFPAWSPLHREHEVTVFEVRREVISTGA